MADGDLRLEIFVTQTSENFQCAGTSRFECGDKVVKRRIAGGIADHFLFLSENLTPFGQRMQVVSEHIFVDQQRLRIRQMPDDPMG